MFLLHLPILLHQWSIRYPLWLLYLIFDVLLCRFGLRWFRSRRCETPIIIEVQIETQFQRLIESRSHIGCDTINAAIMLVDDSWFAVLVSANLCLSADDILRKCLKIFIVGNLGISVNNRLDEKFLVSRQCFLVGMLL